MTKDYKERESYKRNLEHKNNKYKIDIEFRERIKQRNKDYYHTKKLINKPIDQNEEV